MTFPHEVLGRARHDRVAHLRDDEAALEARWADPSSRVLIVAGTRVRPDGDRLPWTTPDAAPEGERVLLGERDGATYFAVITEPRRDENGWLPLRGLLPVLSSDVSDASLVIHALGLAEWRWVTRYCPRCGGELRSRRAGHELVCDDGHATFPRTDPAVIMLITDGEAGSEHERCLLGRQGVWPEGRYSTLAGFCEPGESLESAVRREVLEETGVRVGEVTYFGNQPWPLPASLMVGFFGRAETTQIAVDDDELDDARWLTRAEMKAGAEAGTLVLPSGVSISRSLVESWYGEPLPGAW